MRDKRFSVSVAPLTYIVFAFGIVLLPLHLFFAWTLAVIVHECGHLVACRLCGIGKYEIRIHPYGMRISTEGLPILQQLITSLAGPITGLVVLCFARWCPVIAIFSLALSVFNLLPLADSDGYHALHCVLCLFASVDFADRACQIADIVSRLMLWFATAYISWVLYWPVGIVVCILLLCRTKRKSCKEATLRVQ